MRLTEEEIEAGRSPAGGWTRAQLAKWGVPWPPPKGWRARLTGRKGGKARWTPAQAKAVHARRERQQDIVMQVLNEKKS
jgi:hypothetical protein